MPRSVVEHNVQAFDVVDDFAAQQPMHAATVVADHAAQRAAAVRGGIGRVGQVVHLGCFAQRGRAQCPAPRRPAWPQGQWTSARACSASNRRPRPHWRTARQGWCRRHAAAPQRPSRGTQPALLPRPQRLSGTPRQSASGDNSKSRRHTARASPRSKRTSPRRVALSLASSSSWAAKLSCSSGGRLRRSEKAESFTVAS